MNSKVLSNKGYKAFNIYITTYKTKDDDGVFYQSTLLINSQKFIGEYMRTEINSEKSVLQKFVDQYKTK